MQRGAQAGHLHTGAVLLQCSRGTPLLLSRPQGRRQRISRPQEGLTVANVTKCHVLNVCMKNIIKRSSPSQWQSFLEPTGPMRRVTWLNVRHTGTHACSSFPVVIPCLSAFYWLFPINCLVQFLFMLWKHWIFQIEIVKVFIAADKHFTVMAHIWIS